VSREEKRRLRGRGGQDNWGGLAADGKEGLSEVEKGRKIHGQSKRGGIREKRRPSPKNGKLRRMQQRRKERRPERRDR